MSSELPYRKAKYAGAWYAQQADELREEIDRYVEAASKGPDRYEPVAAVLPHAGIFYSGRGIAALFANLPEQTRRICILSPSHYTYLQPGRLTSADFSSLETPLGDIGYRPLCPQLGEEVKLCDSKALKEEHAVEMFLPFIARANELREQSIEVSMGLISQIQEEKTLSHIAGHLLEILGKEELLDRKTLLIASSDFTHYGDRFGHTPFGTDDMVKAMDSVKEDDLWFAGNFAEGQVSQLLDRCAQEHPTICGFAPALIVSAMAKELKLKGVVADYYTSNDLSQVVLEDFVAYCSIIRE